MRKFLRNLLLALIPVAVINALCWGTLVFLAWQDDLTYVNYASALDKEKRLEELGNQSRLLIIGGSNARFGFDSSILRDTLHLEPVNMGIHIGLGLNYMFEEVYDHLRKGDVLLVSAEYNHFLKEGSYYGDEGLTDMYLIKHEWGKALYNMVNTHNFFSMYRLIRKRVKRIGMDIEDIPENMEVRTKYNEYGDYTGHYKFNEDDSTQIELTNGQDAAVIAPGYLVNKPWFVYDSETGLYKRFQNGEAQTDGNNGEQVAVKNVIIQICGWSRMSNDDEYLDMETMAGGNGYYITNGKAIPVTWSKDSLQAPTRYFDADGNEITLNQGKTWVCVTEDTYADKIAFYASEEEYADR